MTEISLTELLKLMLNDLMNRANDVPHVQDMYQAGRFTGLANALDHRSPHCAKSVEEALMWYGEAVGYLAAWRIKRTS